MQEIILSEKPLIRAYNGDCMDFMQNSDIKYDLAICDPPYGININTSIGRRKGDKKSNYHKFAGEDKNTPDINYFNKLLDISHKHILWGANYYIDKIAQPNSKNWIIWDKMFSNEVTFSAFELAWSNIDKTGKIFKYSPNSTSRIHPTEKPIQLYKWILSNYAKEGNKILDTHGGSMSIAIACYDLGFDLDIIELDTEYFEKAVKRFKKHISQQTIFDTL